MDEVGYDITDRIPIRLTNGKIMYVETSVSGEQLVSNTTWNFSDISDEISGITEDLHAILSKVKPNKASIEFGIDLSIESGKLASVLVKGKGKANVKVTLEWSNL